MTAFYGKRILANGKNGKRILPMAKMAKPKPKPKPIYFLSQNGKKVSKKDSFFFLRAKNFSTGFSTEFSTGRVKYDVESCC